MVAVSGEEGNRGAKRMTGGWKNSLQLRNCRTLSIPYGCAYWGEDGLRKKRLENGC